MIELNKIQYKIQTPTENAYDLVSYINTYCSDNQIKNRKGEVIQIDINPTNPLFLMIFGFGYLVSILQNLLYSLGTGISIADASERQLLNLADMAGIKRSKATKTTIPCTVIASEFGQCTVTTDLSVSIRVGATVQTFHPLFDVIVPAGSAKNIILGAEEYGAFTISAGTVTSFDDSLYNMRELIQYESIPGQDQETIAGLRKRLQDRTISGSLADRAADAIKGLNGVSMCSVYYNYRPASSVWVGDIEVPPRQALLIVQGYNENIARTFYSYLICLTVNGTNAIEQDYVTNAGQVIPVYITPPVTVPIHLDIFYFGKLSATDMDHIYHSLMTMSANLVIAQVVYTSDIITQLHEDWPDIDIKTVNVSLDGQEWSYRAVPLAHQLITFVRENISYTEARV